MSGYIKLGIYEYNPADVLGSGAFAIVYKGRFRDKPDKKVAIKQMIKGQNVLKSKTLLSKEISVLKDLNHDHIVRLYDHSISNSEVYLVMEFCNGGDLSEYLHSRKILPEETIRHFLIQIGSAMDAMNRRAIMHRDLKPGNILLSFYGEYPNINEVPGHLLTFKLADFGFARFLQDGVMAETMCGSPMYMAPEVLMCRKYDARADIWSMGIIVYQCFVGRAPFYANSPEALKNIYEKTINLKPKIPRDTNLYLRDLLLKMLIRKPTDRIDFPSFLAHPFLQAGKYTAADFSPKKPASVPPLPSKSVAAEARTSTPISSKPSSNSSQIRAFAQRTSGNIISKPGEPQPSRIAALMPVCSQSSSFIPPSQLNNPTRVSRLLKSPATYRKIMTQLPLAPAVKQLANDRPPPPSYLRRVAELVSNNHDSFPDHSVSDSHSSNLSESSLRAVGETGDEFMEDGLGGSSFLCDRGYHLREFDDVQLEPGCALSTSGYDDLDPCLADVLQFQNYPRNLKNTVGNRKESDDYKPTKTADQFRKVVEPVCLQSLDREHLSGFIIVNSDGTVLTQDGGYNADVNPSHRTRPPDYYDYTLHGGEKKLGTTFSNNVQKFHPTLANIESRQNINKPAFPIPDTNQLRIAQTPTVPWSREINSDNQRVCPTSTQAREYTSDVQASVEISKPALHQTSSDANIYIIEQTGAAPPGNKPRDEESERGSLRRCTTFPETYSVDYNRNSGAMNSLDREDMCPNETTANNEENLMEADHKEEVRTVTMVLELCELLTELAERRASALTDCTTTADPELSADDHGIDEPVKQFENPSAQTKNRPSKKLKFPSEAKRIVEQLVLYRRILYYLEYVFAQVRKAVDNVRLKPTTIAKRRLTDCNTLYHRCYIRLCQLARQSRREDLIEPVGRLLSHITANRLIFNYALDQCYAAEMDDYIGELGLCLQRYRAAITLVHGLCQHAKTPSDKSLLSDCMRLIRDRYANLWNYAFGGGPYPIETDASASPQRHLESGNRNSGEFRVSGESPPDMMPGLGDGTVALGLHLTGASAIPAAAAVTLKPVLSTSFR